MSGAVDLRALARAFDLPADLQLDPLGNGLTGAAYRLRAGDADYFLKTDAVAREAALYARVAVALNEAGVRQARIFSTVDGSWSTPDGLALYEFLPGGTPQALDGAQADSLAGYFARYNRALRGVPLPGWVRERRNPWQRADSLDYLLDEFPAQRWRLTLSPAIDAAMDRALDQLARYRPVLSALPRQLIHGDTGPGNVLFSGPDVVAIIDFTPYEESPLYAFAVSLYWHFVFFNDGTPDLPRLARMLRRYDGVGPRSSTEKEAFFPLLIKAAARMLFVLLVFNLDEADRFPRAYVENFAAIFQRLADREADLRALWRL